MVEVNDVRTLQLLLDLYVEGLTPSRQGGLRLSRQWVHRNDHLELRAFWYQLQERGYMRRCREDDSQFGVVDTRETGG